MLSRLYAWYGKRTVLVVCILVVILIIVGLSLGRDTEEKEEVAAVPTTVVVRPVGELKTGSSFSVIGQVSALSEAKLQTEAGGRVTRVSVSIGDYVPAGTVLASIENGEEQASLLQAEGAYESALAGSKQSGVSLEQTKITARNTYRDTFTTAENTVYNLLDEFFINPGTNLSGFRLGGTGKAEEFNLRRTELQDELNKWSASLNNTTTLDETAMLTYAESVITEINQFTADIYTVVTEVDEDTKFTDEVLASYKTRLAAARGTLAGSVTTLTSVKEGIRQAELAGSAIQNSQASASIKSALGNLRSAQARFEKTLVRSPISGMVNALYIKSGDYVTPGQAAALVANNGSLEVTTALGETDVAQLVVGDTVTINNSAPGKITKIAPAIDPLTQKAEVKISVDDALSLTNGTTVTVTFSRTKETPGEKDGPITLPLSAVKLLPSGSIVFGVSENDTLEAYPVTLGEILGESVEVVSGLTREQAIVVDVRGLKEGDTVLIAS
jgi:RND family efflux transporter MFP subunit